MLLTPPTRIYIYIHTYICECPENSSSNSSKNIPGLRRRKNPKSTWKDSQLDSGWVWQGQTRHAIRYFGCINNLFFILAPFFLRRPLPCFSQIWGFLRYSCIPMDPSRRVNMTPENLSLRSRFWGPNLQKMIKI